MDAAFARETSLTLERGGRRGAEAVRGAAGTGGCQEPAGEGAGFNLPWRRRDRGHRRLRGHPVWEAEAESAWEGGTLGTGRGVPRMPSGVGRDGVLQARGDGEGLGSLLLPGEGAMWSAWPWGAQGGPHQQPPAPAGSGAMGRGQGLSHAVAVLACTHLLTGLASLAGGASGARQTLGRKKRSDETPWRGGGDQSGRGKGRHHPQPGWCVPSGGKGTSLTWKPGAPAGPCSPLSPAGPWGRGEKRERGQSAPETHLWWPSTAAGGRGLIDTHGRARRTLGTSFTILASSTLWKREERVLRAQP